MKNIQELSGSHAGGQLNNAPLDATTVNDILMAGDKSKGERPYFMNSPETERVLNVALSIASELAVVRERLDTLERLLENSKLLNREEIEGFEPDDQAAEDRQLWHARYSARILRIFQQELDAITRPENNKPMHEIANDINEM